MVKMIEHSCEIDVLLGIKETRFMRDIADTAYSVMGLAVFIFHLTIFTGILCISVGALSSVQALIIYGKTEMDTLKKYILISWLVLSWLYFVGMSVLVDIFSRQIEQTKLICTYAQLKYINNEAVYQFAKPILRALEVRVARTSIYGLFFFDPGAMLRIAASTFLYFTVQIQFSMPAEEIGNSGNVTNADCVEISGKL
ncbi:uncharacterized protein LOC114365137 [Ostrinia furnacalis]|uniref:uncharacterized protein LOC114365137 n=1 Tax=Ostrinia furnacalis TaxID=93504 RepID=UPI001038BD55|nr:uncharacterized protein LOC114365137 [Ostrinia furnacalis]